MNKKIMSIQDLVTDLKLAGANDNTLHLAINCYALGVITEREACHALRQTIANPHSHCQVSAHAYDMAVVAYGAAIRLRGSK